MKYISKSKVSNFVCIAVVSNISHLEYISMIIKELKRNNAIFHRYILIKTYEMHELERSPQALYNAVLYCSKYIPIINTV